MLHRLYFYYLEHERVTYSEEALFLEPGEGFLTYKKLYSEEQGGIPILNPIHGQVQRLSDIINFLSIRGEEQIMKSSLVILWEDGRGRGWLR